MTATVRKPILFALALAIAALAAAAAPAEAQVNWPTDRIYNCTFTRADGSGGSSQIQFDGLAGNNYLRRGILETWIPTQAYPDWFDNARVTVTKPVYLDPRSTSFELTVQAVTQCKRFVVRNAPPIYPSLNSLIFDQCDNGVFQICFQPAQ